MEPEPYSLQGQRCVVANGSSFCMDLHQWRYVDHNTVHWQLLGPFVSIWGGSGSPVDVHQILRLSRLALSALLVHLDMDYERVIHPSKRAVRAAMAAGGARIATEFTRDSWTINTEGLLLVLGHFAASCRKACNRTRAEAALSTWGSSLVDWPVADDLWDAALARTNGLCAHVCRYPGLCAFINESLSTVQQLEVPAPDKWARLFVLCIRKVYSCVAIKTFVKAVVEILSVHVFERIAVVGAVTAPLKIVRHAVEGGRRRTYQEAFKTELHSGLIAKHKALTGSAAAKVEGVDGRRLREWQTQLLMSTLQACRRTFSVAVGTFCLCEDAATLGKPARETKVYCAWHADSGDATWLLNQASPEAHLSSQSTSSIQTQN